jgi:murein DD-endopeptidase MepM/ murein hydrolase activator NlpD
MNKILLSVAVVLAATATLIFLIPDRSIDLENEEIITLSNLSEIEEAAPKDEFGVMIDGVQMVDETVKRNESFYTILKSNGVSSRTIYEIVQEAKGIVDLTEMRPGQDYRLYKERENVVGFSWRRGATEFTQIHLEPEISIENGQFPIETTVRSVSGTIRSSLANSLMQKGVSQKLVVELANIYAWTVDFYGIQPGDRFKAVYEDRYVNGEYIGIGRVHAAEFMHRGKILKAYYFNHADQEGYFDEEGNSMRRMMMRVPFEYNPRISSGFSRNRMHPILNQRRPHYGTDYAAPYGTPILAAGDGVITEARYRGGNGNIVQIRHNSVYKTAYLHMSRFGRGIRAGARVEQGQVIGYVGQTGLATGPHLCYRLYKHGQPINSVTYDFPPSEGVQDAYMDQFQVEVERLEQLIRTLEASPDLAIR